MRIDVIRVIDQYDKVKVTRSIVRVAENIQIFSSQESVRVKAQAYYFEHHHQPLIKQLYFGYHRSLLPVVRFMCIDIQ